VKNTTLSKVFYPERIVSRILGHGRHHALIERAEQAVDKKPRLDLERKLRTDGFTLEISRSTALRSAQMGPLDQLWDMLPKVGPLQNIPKDASVG